jgi:signal peptidase II
MLKCFHWLFLTVLVIFFDQYLKWDVRHHLVLHDPLMLNAYFNLYLDYNHGAAWNFLSNQSGWQRWVLAAFSTVVSIIILFWIKNSQDSNKFTCAGLALILGGAVGNLIDRIYPGVVTDFIQWHVGTHYWPTFNIADSAVCFGAVLFIWGMKND